jgi:uncharacterized membrane protein required for colicin V production
VLGVIFFVFSPAQDFFYQFVSSIKLATCFFLRFFGSLFGFLRYFLVLKSFFLFEILSSFLILSRSFDCLKVVTRKSRDLCTIPFGL